MRRLAHRGRDIQVWLVPYWFSALTLPETQTGISILCYSRHHHHQDQDVAKMTMRSALTVGYQQRKRNEWTKGTALVLGLIIAGNALRNNKLVSLPLEINCHSRASRYAHNEVWRKDNQALDGGAALF
ncbi:hypothetical protein F4774DRAFT_408687 [Daldinia eschscholtzii]|nr:hypothetical protein F4774DRAFT_408687 [Daldinia eschscholtzii]